MQIDLGYAPSNGNRSIDQCEDFKRLIWQKCGRNSQWGFLKTIFGGDRRGIAVEYDSGEPGAAEWAKSIVDHAEWAWDQVSKGVKPETTKLIVRSRS